MSSSFEIFKKQLDDAIHVIEDVVPFDNRQKDLPQSTNSLVDTESLLARCESICQKYQAEKPVIRIIHHLACSGGTLISKCLSSMPNVYLLSEVHPYSNLHLGEGKPKYLPSDISSLIKYADIPNHSDLAGELFVSNIIKTFEHVNLYGGTLILRDHTHSDFCLGNDARKEGSVYSLLAEHFQIKNIVTIRNPIDAYLSLVKNNWKHFTPFTFDEYCRRFIAMTEFYAKSDIYRYEDLVNAPALIMKKMCSSLAIEFSSYFEDTFELFRVTGDSGRSSSTITERARRELPADFLSEIKDSTSFKKINQDYNFQ